MSVLHFLSYNNAVPIAVSIVILGGTATFAATNPETIYSEQETVISIDNTYLVAKDLFVYSPTVQITGVTEDDENYYVEYDLSTIDLDNYVWKDVVRSVTMKVSKTALGTSTDLGVYVTKQLNENIDSEKRRLAETQEIEKRNVSQKVVATAYGGLVGKMLDASTEVIPGYTPVVVAPPEPQAAAAAEAGSSPSAPQAPVPQEPGAPIIQVLGNNPASVTVGVVYSDLGAVITGPTDADRNLGVKIFLNDSETTSPSIDTSKAGNWFIRYEATNSAGKKGVAERVVIVTDPNAQPAPESTPAPEAEPEPETGQADAPAAESASTTASEPAPEPAPETGQETATSSAQ